MQGSIKSRKKYNAKDRNGKLRKEVTVFDVQYRYKDPKNGKWKNSRKRGFWTKKEAETFLLELNHQQETGTFRVETRLTMREYLTDWLESYAQTADLRQSTYVGYRRIVHNKIIPRIGEVTVQKLTGKQIEDMYADLRKNGGERKNGGGLSNTTIAYIHRVLNEALKHAVAHQIIAFNPMQTIIHAPTRNQYKAETYTGEEVLKLLELSRGTYFELPIALSAICGLRRGECLGIRMEDIDFDARTLTIQRQLTSVDNNVAVGKPKTENSNRRVALPDEVWDILSRQIKRNETIKAQLGSEYHDDGWIVCNTDGRMINPTYFTKNFSNFLIRHQMRPIRYHDLRHTCASLMLQEDVDLKVTSSILGHSTIAITADLYTHVSDETKRNAVNQLGKLVFGAKKNDADK